MSYSYKYIMSYNLLHLPGDILRHLRTDSAKNWLALAACVIIYWGGTAFLLYMLVPYILAQPGKWFVVLLFWLLFCVVNVALIAERPGLFYYHLLTDDRPAWPAIWFMLLGPIGTLRSIASWFFLTTRIATNPRTMSEIMDHGYNGSTGALMRTSVDKWPESNSWQRTIKRQIELPTVRFRTRCKRALRLSWKIANKRIEII